MMKGSDIGIQEKKAKLYNEWERFTSNERESIESYYHRFLKLMNDLKRNKHFPEKLPAISNPTTAMNMALALMAKEFNLNYSTPTNNNQRISSNPRNRQITQPGMNMGQHRQMQMVKGNGGNQFRQNTNQNQIGNGNLVAARAEGNADGQNRNQIRCYNCRGVGHYARNCTVRPRRKDVAYLQTQLLIAQKEEAGIQLQAKEFHLMADAADLDEIKEVNANGILMANMQQASTSGTQNDKDPVYDSDGSAEYTELLEPIPEQQQVPQNDINVISKVTSVEQGGETVEQHPRNFEETRALYDSLYQNLAIKVEKVNSVNRKLKETNSDLTTKLARFKNQEKCFEISQEKYDKLERCYQQSIYQEQCLSKKINALHLSIGKQIMTLNEQISDLNKQLSKEKSTVSFLLKEKKRLKSDFKTHEDELLDKQIQLEKKIKELNNILVKTAKFVRDFKSLAKEADDSLVKHKALELEIERLLRAVASQDIMSVVSDQKDNTHDTSANTKYEKQPIVENLPTVGETHALSKPVTSNSVSTPQESKGVNNDKVIAPGMFRINPFKTSRSRQH
nr:hypothetical protein [Tanacetum cinerariifolium]